MNHNIKLLSHDEALLLEIYNKSKGVPSDEGAYFSDDNLEFKV